MRKPIKSHFCYLTRKKQRINEKNWGEIQRRSYGQEIVLREANNITFCYLKKKTKERMRDSILEGETKGRREGGREGRERT